MSKESSKKRTQYTKGSFLDLPEHVEKSKYHYRFINKSKLAAASDGYEPRGFELDRSPGGQTTSRDDLILGRMPIDRYHEMKEQKDEERLNLTEAVLNQHREEDAKLNHEFERAGGRIKFKYEQE